MKKTAAFLVKYALEHMGVKHTFGIPGVHNTEIYDELNKSKEILPVLVTHEAGAAFMADGVSRTNDYVGTLVIVPAAGTTHAMSGIGEAYLDGIPMLIISGGTRRDSGKAYQLHQLDLGKVLNGIIKKYYLIETHETVVSTLFEAYQTAVSGEPGPVYVEIPVELQMFEGEVGSLPEFVKPSVKTHVNEREIIEAVDLLVASQKPGIYLGWGAVDAYEFSSQIAEALSAPVATTMQGISAFPASNPFHVGMGFGNSAVPAAKHAFEGYDCLLAIGVRFAELATGSYGMEVPENLIHIDINPDVFHKNYPAKVAIQGDASELLKAIWQELRHRTHTPTRTVSEFTARIAKDKETYFQSWIGAPQQDRVSPGHFYQSLSELLPENTFMVVDDGKHTFLTAELYPVTVPRHFISPTDFNCMGYCVPAAVGVKLTHPTEPVVAIVGDGAFLMTGLELLTAVSYGAGVMVFVFHDGELGQISQFQRIPLNRKTCTVLGDYQVKGIADAVGAHFISMENDQQIIPGIKEAYEQSQQGIPVVVDVKIDYSRKTAFTKGVVKTNMGRMALKDKVRFLSRALKRHVVG